ncbi:2-nitropropane dioxygenase [Microbacterium sp.]|uniref:2-nitropropane dioxygenase n=1 Tax=Microbacterium sp. TaxID=51671 RepID=UPI002810DD3A|nr:2-nitropropane dioxygenase [Microbacterium sp.]
MQSWDTTPISLEVRLAFTRAAVQVIGRRADARLLHIKGSTVEGRLRGAVRGSTDVDVLIDPSAVDRMHWELLRSGWRVYSTFVEGSPFEHAQTYFHPEWGYLDLHRRFPGIRIPDQDAFELLWTGRGEHVTAGITCAVPSADVQGVLLTLNAARDPERRSDATTLWAQQTPEERARRTELVRRLRAEVAVAAALGDLDRYRGRPEYLLWKTVSQGGGRVAEWWGRIRAAPTIAAAIRTAARAPLVNRSSLEHELGRPPGRRDIAVAYLRRIRTASRDLLGRRGQP